EQVTVLSDAMEFMERESDRHEMAERERELAARLERGELSLDDLLRVPLYPYQMRGALFAAYRGRCILGDDMGLGKTVQTLAAAELLARDRGVERVLVVAPASVKYQWESEIRKFTDRPVQVIEGGNKARRAQYLHEHRFIDDKGKLIGYRNLDRIRQKLEPILLRRTRAEVLTQLPARTDNTVFVEMTEAQRGPYAEQQFTLARLVNKKYLTEV